MPDTFSVRHPSGKVIRFPQGTPDADVATAMGQLDQPTAPATPPISTTTPVADPSASGLAKLGEPYHPSDSSMDFAERRLRSALSPAAVASGAGQIEQAAAAKALNASRVGVNLSPQAAALDPAAAAGETRRASLEKALAFSPALKDYAATSAVHTDAIAPDATNLAAVGRGFFGEQQDFSAEDQADIEASSRYLRNAPSTSDTISQVLMKHTSAAMADFVDALIGLYPEKGGVPPLGIPLESMKSLSRSLHQGSEVDLSKEIPGPAESVLGVAPSLALYSAGGAAGKAGLFSTAFAQNYGALKHAGVDDGLAVSGAAAGAAIFMVPGSKFFSGLLGKASEREVQEAASQAMLELAKQPALKQGLITWGKHALSGWLMTVGSALSNKVTMQVDDWAKTGRVQDPSELWQTMWDATKQSGGLLPWAGIAPLREHMELAPLREFLEQKGKEVAAHADQVKLAQLTGPLQETKLIKEAPEEAKKIVKTMADDAGERWANEEQPPPGSKERAGVPIEETHFGEKPDVAAPPGNEASRVVDLNNSLANQPDPHVRKVLLAFATIDGKPSTLSGAELKEWLTARFSPPGQTTDEARNLGLEKALSAYGIKGISASRQSGAPPTKALIDAATLRSVAVKMGLDAEKVAEHVTGDPDALREAEATGRPLSVPIENLAVDLGPMAKDLSKGVSLDPDNPSLAEVERPKLPSPESNLASLLTEWDVATKTPVSPERTAKIQDVETRMRALMRGLPTNRDVPGRGGELSVRDLVGGGGKPPVPPPPPVATGPAPEAPEPSAKARKAQAEAAMAGKTLDSLTTDSYRRGAAAAQKEIDKLRQRVEDKLASAEQTAQQGVDLAVDAAERARQGIYKASGATDEALLNYLRGSESTQQRAEDKSVSATEKTVSAGSDAAEASRHMGIRDMNNAMEAARVKALKEANKIQASVGKLSSGSTRERLYAAGEIYGQLYDHLMEQMDLRAREPNAVREDPDVLMELLQASYGSDMPFDKGHILYTIERGNDLGGMKLDGARNVNNFLDVLNTLARESRKAYVQGKLAERSEVIVDITRNLRAQNPGAEFVLNPKQAEPPGFFRKQYEKISSMMGNVAKNNFQTLLAPLGKWGESHFLRTLGAEKVRAGIDRQIEDALGPTSKLPNLGDRVPWPDGMAVSGVTETISRADMLHLRRLTGTVENMKDIADATGVHPVEWERWFDKHMTEADYKATQHAWDALKALGEQTAATNANRGGTPMVMQTPREISTQFGKFRGGYGGGMRWLENPNELPKAISAEDPMRGNRVATDTRHGLTITRTPQKFFPDFSSTNARAHFNEQAHDIAFSEVIRDGHRMLNDPSFQRTVETYMGPEWYKRLVETHNLMADGGRIDVDRGIGTVNALYTGGRVVAGVTFPFNVNTMAKMSLHPLQDAFIQGGSRHLLSAVFRSISPEGRLEANQNSRVVSLYTNEGYRRLMQMQRDLEGRMPGVGSKIADTASMATTWMQSQIMAMQAHVVWQTHKFEALADHASLQEAYDHADKRTAAALPANTVLRQSAQNRNAVFASQNLVYNFEGAFWNMKQQQEIERRAGVELEGRSKVGSYALRTISRLAGYTALGLGLWVGGQGRNPEEEKADAQGTGPLGPWTGSAQWVARTLLIEKYFGSPVMHKIMEVASPLMVGEKPGHHYGVFTPPADELFTATWDDFVKTVNSDRSTPDRVESAFKAIARFIPGAVQASRTGRAAYRLLGTQDFDPQGSPRGVFDVFDSLARGPHPRNASLLSDVQGAVSGQSRSTQ